MGSLSWQAGRAVTAVLSLQAAFLLLGPLKPVILWTGAQEKAEQERGGVVSLVPGVRSRCTEEESEAVAPNCSCWKSQGGSKPQLKPL